MDLADLKEQERTRKLRVHPNDRAGDFVDYGLQYTFLSEYWRLARILTERGFSILLKKNCEKRIANATLDERKVYAALVESRKHFIKLVEGSSSGDDNGFSFWFVRRFGPRTFDDPLFRREALGAWRRHDGAFFKKLGAALRDHEKSRRASECRLDQEYPEHMILLTNWFWWEYPKTFPLILCSPEVLYDICNFVLEKDCRLDQRDRQIEVLRKTIVARNLRLPTMRKPPIRSMIRQGRLLVFD